MFLLDKCSVEFSCVVQVIGGVGASEDQVEFFCVVGHFACEIRNYVVFVRGIVDFGDDCACAFENRRSVVVVA